MKRVLWLLAAMCLIPICALAEDYELDDRTIFSGMDKSWMQGYEPTASGENLTVCLPVKSDRSNGKLTATLVMDDEEISPIRSDKLSADFWRSDGMFRVKLSFKLSEGRVNGDYSGRVLLEGKDNEGNDLFSAYPVNIRIRDGQINERVQPEITEVAASLVPGREGVVTMKIINPGRVTTMEDVILTVADETGEVLSDGSDKRKIPDIAPNGEAEVEYPVVVKADSTSEFYRLQITLRYTALGGENEWQETFTVFADPADETARPEIRDVSTELTVGEWGEVTAKIVNPSRNSTMQNVILTITDESGEVLPVGSDVTRIADLSPGEEAAVEYQAVVIPNAKAALHRLTFELTYSRQGKEEEWKETFTVPVTQEVRLEQGGIQMASSIIQGDMATLTLPLMNMGKGELMNVMATLTLPGVVDRQSVLVGTIASGETGQAKISFTPGRDICGEVSGEVKVTAEDAWGNQTAFTLPVALTVEEPAPTAVLTRTEAQEETSYLLYALLGGCGLLIFFLVLQGSLLRRKIHRMEEERL